MALKFPVRFQGVQTEVSSCGGQKKVVGSTNGRDENPVCEKECMFVLIRGYCWLFLPQRRCSGESESRGSARERDKLPVPVAILPLGLVTVLVFYRCLWQPSQWMLRFSA